MNSYKKKEGRKEERSNWLKSETASTIYRRKWTGQSWKPETPNLTEVRSMMEKLHTSLTDLVGVSLYAGVCFWQNHHPERLTKPLSFLSKSVPI